MSTLELLPRPKEAAPWKVRSSSHLFKILLASVAPALISFFIGSLFQIPGPITLLLIFLPMQFVFAGWAAFSTRGRRGLADSALNVGVLFATPAIGAIAGSIFTPKLSKRFGRTKIMAWSILGSSVLVFIQGFSPNYWVLAVLVTLGTAIITAWNILLMSTYHQIIPSELFGRIHGTRRTLVWGMMPIGSLLGGLVASVDLRLPFIAGGIACSILAISGFKFIVNLENSLINKTTEEEK